MSFYWRGLCLQALLFLPKGYIDLNTLKKIINDNNKFLLTTHVNPDADAIGSEIAFYNILKRLGKNIKVINHSTTPYNLNFLDNHNIITKFDNKTDKKFINDADVLIALDRQLLNRRGEGQNLKGIGNVSFEKHHVSEVEGLDGR